ncbi:Chromosome 1 open reading frame 9 [Strongyloides ratti]|uniref:Chromosome 1 open reading frame 9 n=1 Tax=Strongyloides ratti TaxID=34506 RepID=A0A090LP57_STRRB|nr:Chromosome 1 open reading frame 9 [Strongyloides ratti]CEF69290.1 Chromosome 1 open reading frame 9 [Strongyloides ratti]
MSDGNFKANIIKIGENSIFFNRCNKIKKLQEDVCVAEHAFNWSKFQSNSDCYNSQLRFDEFCELPNNRFMSNTKKSINTNSCEMKDEDKHLNHKINLTDGPCSQYKEFNIKNNKSDNIFEETIQSNSFVDNHNTGIEKEIISKTSDESSVGNFEGDSNEKKEPQIAPFDEWTKEKLKMNIESNNKVNSVSTENISIVSSTKQGTVNKQLSSVTTKRNYASKECGAKVLLSNDEAEFKSAILNDKERDIYMRNPCEKAQQKFSVIELCETIVPTGIELANFELFSSGPKEFKVFVSERFPTTEWHQIGEFEMMNSREIQKFDLIKTGLYVKYAKIELTSHWGKEHYCTLSMVRVFGISMVEEYEAEASVINIPILPVSVVNSATNQTLDTSISQSKELVSKEINKSSNDDGSVKTLVDKVVNAVGSKIESILNTVMKNGKTKENSIKLESLTLEEQCTKCLVDHDLVYSHELCHFYNYVIRIISRRNIIKNTNKNKTVTPRSPPPSLTSIKKYREHDKYVKTKKRQRRRLLFQKYLNEKIKKEEEVSSIEKKIIFQNGGDHSLPAANMNYKESVFLKLNKRLSNLELNISLTSEYLSELSKRYVSQTSDNMKMHESTIKKSEELIKRLMNDFKFEIEQQINLMKGEILSFKKNNRNYQKMGFFDSSLSVTKPPEIVNGDCPSGRHLLNNGNDKIWTTEQVLFVVVGTQFITIVCIFLLQWLFSWLYSKKEESKKEKEIEKIRNEIEMLKNIVLEESDQEEKEVVEVIDDSQPITVKKKKRRKKKTIIIDNDWDSALDNPSLPSETPTPSELSIETDRIPLTLCNGNVPFQKKHNLLLTADGFQIHSNKKNSKLKKINSSLIINA